MLVPISDGIGLLCPFVRYTDKMYLYLTGKTVVEFPEYLLENKDPSRDDKDALFTDEASGEYASEDTVDWLEEAAEEEKKAAYFRTVKTEEMPEEEWEEWLAEVKKAAERSFAHRFDHLPDKDRFVTEYMSFRRSLAEADISRLPSDMERLVDIFLYNKGISAF